ncbi:MAG: LTA synthase family protein, partial [Oscillospiraceae bacterium]|nr:LTA synthase family protein [Oscillospiraceae bacterium]
MRWKGKNNGCCASYTSSVSLTAASFPSRGSLLVLCLGPVAAFFIVELLNQTHLWEDFMPWQVVMNLVWYALIFFVCRLILGRDRRAAAAGALLCAAAGLANHYVYSFRGRIIFPSDLDPSAILTALNVAGNYDYGLNVSICRALIVLACYLILVERCPAQLHRVPLHRPVIAVTIVGYAIYIVLFFFSPMLPAFGIYTQQWKTNVNGFLLNFTIALRYSIVEEPKGYSPQAVEELAAQYDGEAPDESRQPVNLICIMNEAWADFATFGDALQLTDDPMPFYHGMTENTVKGNVYMPVTGGGTANAEYEFITGNALDFLPINTVAYQLYIEEDFPSLARQAGAAGYQTTAFHPYKSSGWNRTNAYADLGFDVQMYEEAVESPKMVRQFISDESNYEIVQQLTEQDGRQFIFNVTMQNHSSYSLSWRNLERSVALKDSDAAYADEAAQYFSLMRASDDALRGLIEYYEQSDEPTMIVMFGDHQPSITGGFYEMLYGKKLDGRTTEEVMRQYATPFFLWANYDIAEADGLELPASALGALTAQMAGIGLTGQQEFLLDLAEEFAAVCPAGYRTQDGVNTASRAELSEKQQELLTQYEIMNYCNLFDAENRPRELFYLN